MVNCPGDGDRGFPRGPGPGPPRHAPRGPEPLPATGDREAFGAVPPGRERDGLLAVAYLRLYQVVKRPEYLFRGYSYARTARVEEVRALAERLWEER